MAVTSASFRITYFFSNARIDVYTTYTTVGFVRWTSLKAIRISNHITILTVNNFTFIFALAVAATLQIRIIITNFTNRRTGRTACFAFHRIATKIITAVTVYITNELTTKYTRTTLLGALVIGCSITASLGYGVIGGAVTTLLVPGAR